MNDQNNNQLAIDVLFAINSVIIVNKLYLPASSRIKSSLLRSYKILSNYLDTHNNFSVAFVDQQATINGESFDLELVQEEANLIVFDYLESLSLTEFNLSKDLTENDFSKFILLLSSSRNKIDREGGVSHLITSLGIGGFFSGEAYRNIAIDDISTNRSGLDKLAVDDVVSIVSSKSNVDGDLSEIKNSTQPIKLEKYIDEILAGNLEVLANEELLTLLPRVLKEMYKAEDLRCIDILNVFASQKEELTNVHLQHLLPVLVVISKVMLKEREVLLFPPIVVIYKYLLLKKNNLGSLLHHITTILYRMMNISYGQGYDKEGNEILSLFNSLRTDRNLIIPSKRDVIAGVQDAEIDRSLVDIMILRYLANNQDDTARQYLVLQGPVVTSYLVHVLISFTNQEECDGIISILVTNKEYAAVVALDKLRGDIPWIGKRNLLSLIKATGDENTAKDVIHYLRHSDLRVQTEALSCINMISGDEKENLLIDALARSQNKICIKIVKYLSAFDSERSAFALCKKLNEMIKHSVDGDQGLIMYLIKGLSHFQYQSVLGYIIDIKDEAQKSENPIFDEQILSLLGKLQIHLEKKLHIKRKQDNEKLVKLAGPAQPVYEGADNITGLSLENKMRTFFKVGNESNACNLYQELIQQLCETGNYSVAEKLRAWLIDNHPLLLTEIIDSAEIIDEYKARAIDKDHIKVWSNLYDLLSTKEFSSLYHCLSHTVLNDNHLVVGQGKSQKSLYFINAGQVKLFYDNKGHDELIKVLGPGSVIGASAFFDASVWTFSASCIGRTEISVMKFQDINVLADNFPSLESKLRDFCYKFEKLERYFDTAAKDRRIYERRGLEGKITVNLIDEEGNMTGVLPRGELFDASEGGISFTTRLPKKKHVQILLGRKVGVPLPTYQLDGNDCLCEGFIIGVRIIPNMDNEYSVHIKYSRSLQREDFARIVNEINAKDSIG